MIAHRKGMVIKMKEYRVVVAGCRNFADYARLKAELSAYFLSLAPCTVIIVSGCAAGADALGERYAAEHGLAIERFPADWERYGRAAGPMRNRQMAKAADAVIVFWDGRSRGTKSMIECAKKENKPCKIVWL